MFAFSPPGFPGDFSLVISIFFKWYPFTKYVETGVFLHLGYYFPIWEYLHIPNEISWGWDSSANRKIIYISYIPTTHSLKVILYSVSSVPVRWLRPVTGDEPNFPPGTLCQLKKCHNGEHWGFSISNNHASDNTYWLWHSGKVYIWVCRLGISLYYFIPKSNFIWFLWVTNSFLLFIALANFSHTYHCSLVWL